MLVSANACFLKEDYMIDNKPRSKVILDELRAEGNEDNEVPISVTEVNPSLVASTQERGEPRRSGRVVRQPEYFIGLGEVPEGPEIDPTRYDEAIQDKDATQW